MAEVGDGPLISMCAWCLAVRVAGVWHRCPAIPKQDRVADRVTHGICLSCKATLLATLSENRGS